MVHRLLLAVAAASAINVDGSLESQPPVYRIEARSLYDAGRTLGQRAGSRMRGWFESDEMKALIRFSENEGRAAYEALVEANTKEFPQYAAELKAVAEGAGLPERDVWLASMIEEIEVLMPNATARRGEHCSDIYAVADGGYSRGFAHGHNEDWDGIVAKYWYFVEYVPLPGADFQACAGMAYPGAMLGWASTWNEHGMFLTQNTLTPKKASSKGYLSAFMQRDAICGKAAAGGLDAAVAALTRLPWSDGASVNLVDLRAKRMANVEMHLGEHAVTEVTEAMGNYSHFNMYKALGPGVTDLPQASTIHRQARVYELPAPRSADDIKRILSDTKDQALPIFRPSTLSTFVLNGTTGQLDVWCCGHSPASGVAPVQSWNLLTHPISPSVSDIVFS